MLYDADDDMPRGSGRANEILNRLERVYLAAIRAIALCAATLLVIYAIWLAASGLYKTSRDASSVTEEPAVVSAQEVTEIDVGKAAKSDAASSSDPLAVARRYYTDFGKRYYAVFKSTFEPFKKPDDNPLELRAFEQRYLQTSERLEGIEQGALDFEQDRADLESLLTTMTTVASDEKTTGRLRAYQSAKKTPVTRTESGTREETYCSYYGIYTGGCLSYDTRTVPYTRTVQDLKLPPGIISHTDLFGAYQDAYLSKLAEKREANAVAARQEREKIIADNLNGRARLWSALGVIGAFLALMFLFLLIALERHQRKIAASVAPAE